jgi:hypothetical protein
MRKKKVRKKIVRKKKVRVKKNKRSYLEDQTMKKTKKN